MRQIRRLGAFELYYAAAYDLYGAHNVASLYTLSRPITIAALQTCADTLRARHKMLQVIVLLDWKKKRANLVQADHLSTHVDAYDGPLPPDVYFQQLTDGTTLASDDDDDDVLRTKRLQFRERFLPWKLVLIADAHVAFVAQHSIVDGVSCDIIGAEIVRCLNNLQGLNQRASEIVPPVEQIFGPVRKRDSVRSWMRFIALLPKTTDSGGLYKNKLPRDWKQRRYVGCVLDISLDDISSFHNQCRAEKVTLTSGILSALYEILGQRREFNVAYRKLSATISMDCRRKVANDSALSKNHIGCYIATCNVSAMGREGEWAQRARAFQEKLMGVNETEMKLEALCAGWVVKSCGRKLFDAVAYGDEYGRIMSIDLSNIGRARRIDEANQDVEDGGVRVVRMRFDDAHLAIGAYLTVHICSVGTQLTIGIRSCQIFVKQSVLDEVAMALQAWMMKADWD